MTPTPSTACACDTPQPIGWQCQKCGLRIQQKPRKPTFAETIYPSQINKGFEPHQKPSSWEAKKVGGKIHLILNETLYRKLTLKEYKRVTKLIASVFDAASAIRKEI